MGSSHALCRAEGTPNLRRSGRFRSQKCINIGNYYVRDEHEQRKPFDVIVFPQRQSDRPPTPRCEAIQYSYKQNALDKSSKLTMKGIE